MTKPSDPGRRRADRETKMTDRRIEELWTRYLAAEAAGRDAEAEEALAELFRSAESPAPAPGFVGRVMTRIASRSVFRRPVVQLGLAATLLAAAVSAALFAPMLLPLAGLVRPADLLSAAISALASLSVFFASGISVWESAGRFVIVVGRALVEPGPLSFVVAQFAIAAVALRGLLRLARHGRSSSHAVLR